MKITNIISSLVLSAGLFLSGCASNGSKSEKQAEKNPETGMTKAQIIEMYGETNNRQLSNQGETWIYNLNMGEAFIPFNFGYRPKIRMINFDAEGKVTNWSYSK